MTKLEELIIDFPVLNEFVLLQNVQRMSARINKIAGFDFVKLNAFLDIKLYPNMEMTNELFCKIKNKIKEKIYNEN